VGILGKSGSGKSTLMYILGLLEKPTTGNVYIKDKLSSQMDDTQISALRNQTVGFIFQQFNLIPKLSVMDNILLPSVYQSQERTSSAKEYGEYLLNRFGILEKKDSFPNQLSGGQQQRVAIARALINKPEIIIADEPTGNLDTKTGVEIMNLLDEIQENEGKTIILVTHDLEVAKRAKRIIRLEDGVLIKS